MARSSETFGKKEKEKKKQQKKKEKEARKLARKENESGGGLDDMMAYVDENGVITDTPPDPTKKRKEIKAENIQLGYKKEEQEAVDPNHEGKVTFFNGEKGYGFIKDKDSQDSYFVHINNCSAPITEGDKVRFELEMGQKGMAAVKVKKIDAYSVYVEPVAEEVPLSDDEDKVSNGDEKGKDEEE
jgi:cold shock CspA family protein